MNIKLNLLQFVLNRENKNFWKEMKRNDWFRNYDLNLKNYIILYYREEENKEIKPQKSLLLTHFTNIKTSLLTGKSINQN